ncbi:hypothetical protein EMIT0P258_70229 [Pseudomonas sp. IT-P258]
MATPNCKASTARSWPSTPRKGSRSLVVEKLNCSAENGRVSASGARRKLAATGSGIGLPYNQAGQMAAFWRCPCPTGKERRRPEHCQSANPRRAGLAPVFPMNVLQKITEPRDRA